MADILTVVVRYAHVLSAILWIGGLAFADMVLAPAIARLSLPTRRETLQHFLPIVNRFIPMVGISTVAFGALLFVLMTNVDPAAMWGSTWDTVILSALVLALGLLVFGLLVVRRTSMKVLGHLNEPACAHREEVGALQKTFTRSQLIALVWGFIILGFMVYATGGL